MRAPTLAELASRGHENNFDLVRLVAALAVIVSHSFSLAVSQGEPLARLTGGALSIGEIAVDIFFLTSGFLVTGSLFSRRDLFAFIASRLLRIYPGLIVMVILTVTLAGLFAPAGFFVHPDTIHYITATAFLWFPKLTYFHLPGFFELNPWPVAVNGSLHTLPFELRMYGVLAALWLAASLHKRSRLTLMAAGIVGLAVAGAAMRVALPDGQMSRFVFMFFTGGTFFVLRARIRLHGGLAVACAVAVVVSVCNRHMFFVAYNLLLGYALFSLSYLPKLWRPTSDVSYGTYIYAFPIQQCIAMLIPGVTWYAMSGFAIPSVLLLAWLSWHFVEKPAMRLKKHFGWLPSPDLRTRQPEPVSSR